MTQRILRVFVCLVFACSVAASLAQSKEDRETVAKARSIYLTGPVPSSIACGVDLDWERFFREAKIEMNDATKARLEKLQAAKISFVAKEAGETEVKVDVPEGFTTLADGLRQQLSGFFQMYWPMSYGKMLAIKPEEPFELTKTASGYTLKSTAGGTHAEIDMDKAYMITGDSVASPQMNATMTTGFKPGADGLLRLRSLDETVNLGATKMVIDVVLDYQKVGEFEVPQHVRMSLPGSFSFNYTFVGCEVKGPGNDAAKAH